MVSELLLTRVGGKAVVCSSYKRLSVYHLSGFLPGMGWLGECVCRKVGKVQWSEFLWRLCHRNFPVDWTNKSFPLVQAQRILPFLSNIRGFCRPLRPE